MVLSITLTCKKSLSDVFLWDKIFTKKNIHEKLYPSTIKPRRINRVN